MNGRAIGRDIRWAAQTAVLEGVILALLVWLLPGVTASGPGAIVLTAVLIAAAEAVAWPFLYRLAARFHPLIFPALSFVFAGVLIIAVTRGADRLGLDAVHIAGIGTGIIVAVALTAGGTLLGALFSLRDDAAYDWFVVRSLREEYERTPRSSEPGTLFLEIDGLAEPILRQAIAAGYMPALQRWLDEGSHRLIRWEPDLSSQTSASQAGILLGDNTDIPAFRWYDKAERKVMVSSHMSAAQQLEHRLSRGDGLLHDGASRWNIFSGDAPDTVCTYSTFGVHGRDGSERYLASFLNPYTLPRALALFLGDIVRERWQAWRQVRQDVQPRIRRTFKYTLVRAATTTLLQEAAQFMLIADIFRGVPAVYCTFFSYDEVAHHSGIDREDAFKVLTTLDRVFATLERAVQHAPRPYHLVVLSDHGQSMGATFRQRYGQTLGELTHGLIAPEAKVAVHDRPAEEWGHINLALSEALHTVADGRTARLIRHALEPWTIGETVTLGEKKTAPDHHDREAAGSDAVVLASGNLGLISFPAWDHRVTYEEIVARFPTLLPGLLGHDGIGFVMVRSAKEGGLVIGPRGIHYLDHDYAVGEDPLAPYGERAACHLRRTDGFANAPDILVMSAYDPAVNEVSAFEELVGSHGGLGGTQTEPFVLHPVALDPGADLIVGAAALCQQFKQWSSVAESVE